MRSGKSKMVARTVVIVHVEIMARRGGAVAEMQASSDIKDSLWTGCHVLVRRCLYQ